MNLRNYVLKAGTLCALLFVATAARAQSKVGYVDIDRVTGKAKAVNQAMSSVEGKVLKFRDDIETKRKKKRDLEAEIKRQDGVLSSAELDKKRKEVSTLTTELDDLDYRARREMQKVDAEFFEPMLKKIVFAIQDVAKEQDYDLILRGEAVLYGKTATDITDEVIIKLNMDEGSTTPTKSEKKSKVSDSQKDDSAAETEQSKATEETPAPSEEKTPAAKATPQAAAPSMSLEAPASVTLKEPAAPSPTPATRSAPKRPVDRQPD